MGMNRPQIEAYLQSILLAVKTLSQANSQGKFDHDKTVFEELRRIDNDLDDIVESLEE